VSGLGDRLSAIPPAPAATGRAVRAVLWDLDGTLVDSSAYHWRSWRSVLEAEAVAVTEADFHASFGQRNEEILSRWLGPDADLERIRRIGAQKEACYRALLEAEGIAPLPGAAEWVRTLHERGWRQAIASSAPRLNVEAMRRALSFTRVIDAVVSAEDVHAGKPDPEVFLVAAARLGVAPERCVVVEDAAAGVEAARRAGMRSIGVGRGVVGAADVVVASLAELAPDSFDLLLVAE
jgi:HAD superfamily hydrolase (TIGR01509 family)